MAKTSCPSCAARARRARAPCTGAIAEPIRQIQEAMLEGRLKYLARDEHAQLFDLEHDPGEQIDLAGARPAEVARMQARHEAWFAAMTR